MTMEDSARPMYLLMNNTDDGTSRWVLKGVMNTDLKRQNAYVFTNVSEFQEWLIKTGNKQYNFILKIDFILKISFISKIVSGFSVAARSLTQNFVPILCLNFMSFCSFRCSFRYFVVK
jgi:hypothetical protein